MKLIIEDDEGRKTVVPVVRDEISIGRGEDNLVRLTEKNVSRKHARILREGGSYFIEDLQSFTGVRVNGDRVKGRRPVKEGDLIQIGEYDLSLQAAPEEKPAAPAASPLGEDDEPTDVRRARATPPPGAAAEAQARKNAETAVIRLSDLGQQPAGDLPVVEVPPEKRPRLVCVRGPLRGKELVLDRTPITLGRSGENDLEIDHPSISRRHCRLHLDTRSWKILDAESKNGVRVNGEPYATIGLRHGDVLEIGHLRFEFVAPGHLFKMPPEFPVVRGTPGTEPRSRKGLFAGVGVAVAVVAAAGAVFVVRQRGAENDGVEVGTDAKAERRFALRAADEAAAGHRYTEALRNYDAARRAGATAAELRSYEQVKAESRSEELFLEMESAAASQNWERARKVLDALAPQATYYGAKAAEKAGAITSGYVNLHLATAARMKGKDNQGCLAEAQLALQANPQSADAQSLVAGCKGSGPVAAARLRPAAEADAKAQAPAVQAASIALALPAANPADDFEARRLLNDGNQKLVGQEFAAAIALYQKALALKPADAILSGLYRSMGIAFTRQGNIEEGARYYRLYLPLCTNPSEKAQLQKVLDDYDTRRRD